MDIIKKSKKTLYRIRQVLANHRSDKGLLSRIYKELIQLKEKDNRLINGKRLKQMFLQRRCTKMVNKPMKSLVIRDGQVNITMRQSITSINQDGYNHLKIFQRENKCWEDVEKLESSYLIGGNRK